jgi:pentatricopeptide repeat protein
MVEARSHGPRQAAQQDGHGQEHAEHDGTPLLEGQEASDEYALFISDLAAHLRAEKQQEQEQQQEQVQEQAQAPGQEPAEQSPVQPRLATTMPQAEAGPDITAMEGATTDETVLTAPAGEQELLAEMAGVTPFSPEDTAPAAADAYAGPQGDGMPEPQAYLQADVPVEPEHAQPGGHDAAYAGQAQVQAQEAPGQQAEMESSEPAGRFRGDELQFEDFMFDRGAPMPPEASPPAMVVQAFQPTEAEAVVLQGAADAVDEPEPPELRPISLPVPSQSTGPDEDEADQLPFWLRDTAELTAIPELQYLTAEEADEAEWAQDTAVVPDAPRVPETPVSAAAGQVEAEADGRHEPRPSEPDVLSASTVPDDYLDLPPIEPFDFSILQLTEEVARPAEDALGFRTGELLGSMVPVQESEPAGSTMEAGLNALDRLLEVGPPPILEAAPAGADGDVSIDATAAGDAPYTGEYSDSEYDQYGAQTVQTEPGVGTDAGTADRPTTFIRPAGATSATGDTDRPFNWTSMITGSLMAEAETHGEESTGEANASTDETVGAVELNDAYPTALIGNTGSAEETTVSDLGVDPFDFSKLGLEDEEPPTEFLPASTTQPVLVPGTEKLYTSVGMGANGGAASTPQSLQTGAEAEEVQSEPDITGALPSFDEKDEEELWRELGSDTSLFITSHLPQTLDETESEKSHATNWLGGASGDGDEALQQETADAQDHMQMDTHVEGIKARVTSDVWATRRMLTVQDLESFDVVEASRAGTEESPALETAPEPESRARVDAEADEIEAQPMPSEPAVEVPPKPHHKATRPLMVEPPVPPRPRVEPDDVAAMDSGHGSLVSGPLPVLDGFEELLELVTYSPEDMGAHMALAAAYTQAGNLDAALRVYRRMLKKRNNVPTYMLQIIAEELADFEGEFGDRPRFHQVRGDLYMRQGRFREAIEEYNKIR